MKDMVQSPRDSVKIVGLVIFTNCMSAGKREHFPQNHGNCKTTSCVFLLKLLLFLIDLQGK